jgi:hypothetical protein
MRFGRGRWHWYDFVIAALAAVIVYPDKVLDWIGDRTGLGFNWRHVLLLEGIAVGLMFAVMALLMPMYPRLHWWHPLLFTSFFALMRFIMWCVVRLFGFDD